MTALLLAANLVMLTLLAWRLAEISETVADLDLDVEAIHEGLTLTALSDDRPDPAAEWDAAVERVEARGEAARVLTWRQDSDR